MLGIYYSNIYVGFQEKGELGEGVAFEAFELSFECYQGIF